MNFDFSEEQFLFRDTVRDFLTDRWSTARVRGHFEGDGFDAELWTGIAGLGLLSLLVPERHGGLGLGFVDLALVLEEFGRHLVPGPVVETMLATDAIARFGTPEQGDALLPGIAAGELVVVPALVETGGGYDLAETTTLARPSGNGWVLDGSKMLVPFADRADRLLIAVRFGEVDGPVGLVLLEPGRAGISTRRHTLLDMAARAYEVRFEGVVVRGDDVLGGEPRPEAAERLLDAGATAASAELAGAAGRVLDMTVDYAGQRQQFGRPIGALQAIKHRCADMLVHVETARTASYYAAWALARDPAERSRLVSMAKAYCSEAAGSVCAEGLQIHGGIGFTWELDMHLYLRRVKSLESAYGGAVEHRERVLAATLAEMGA